MCLKMLYGDYSARPHGAANLFMVTDMVTLNVISILDQAFSSPKAQSLCKTRFFALQLHRKLEQKNIYNYV